VSASALLLASASGLSTGEPPTGKAGFGFATTHLNAHRLLHWARIEGRQVEELKAGAGSLVPYNMQNPAGR